MVNKASKVVSDNIQRGAGACVPTVGKFQPLSRERVKLGDGLLGQWQERNRKVTIPHVIAEMHKAGNLTNLQRLLGEVEGEYQGRYSFLDTDIFKTLEGLAYEIGSGDADEEAREFFDEACRLLALVQREDGYLNSFFQDPAHPGGPWSDLSWGHEMYNLGHLIQAGIAAKRQMGDDRLLVIAQKFADHVVDLYGPDGAEVTGDHAIIEMAMVELYRETGDEKYLQQAQLFVDRRGRKQFSAKVFSHEYFQDEVPIRDLQTPTGHAVRMTYLASGVTDLGHETGDESLLEVMRRLWKDMVDHKLYITGGLGSRHSDEAIGDRYELPAERAYAETCAAISTMQWAWRLFLNTGQAHYLDTFETILYNAYAVGISARGDEFFYDNPLQRRPDHTMRTGAEADGPLLRRDWFICPCCPPNIVRWMSQLQDHIAVASGPGLVLANYTDASIATDHLEVDVRTQYPWQGNVDIEITAVHDAEAGDSNDVVAGELVAYPIKLRIPQWATNFTIAVNANEVAVDNQDGWVTLHRHWQQGDLIELRLDMQPRLHGSHPYLDATRGAGAVMRGPVVYCLEQQDIQAQVDDVVITPQALNAAKNTDLAHIADVPQAAVGLELTVEIRSPQSPELYPVITAETQPAGAGTSETNARETACLVPYYLWGNRQAQAMRVWLRRF